MKWYRKHAHLFSCMNESFDVAKVTVCNRIGQFLRFSCKIWRTLKTIYLSSSLFCAMILILFLGKTSDTITNCNVVLFWSFSGKACFLECIKPFFGNTWIPPLPSQVKKLWGSLGLGKRTLNLIIFFHPLHIFLAFCCFSQYGIPQPLSGSDIFRYAIIKISLYVCF